MKKIILLIAFFCVYSISFGQTLNEKRAKFFTEEATKEFKLNDEQKKDLLTKRTDYLTTLTSLNQQAKNNEITAEEKQTKTNETNKDFKALMVKLTGKTEKELEPFYVRIREELQKVK